MKMTTTLDENMTRTINLELNEKEFSVLFTAATECAHDTNIYPARDLPTIQAVTRMMSAGSDEW